LQENNNIVNINTIEVFKLIKFFVYYLLNVDKQIFKSYSNNIELFLVSINNKEEFVFVFEQNQELQKEN